MTNLKKSKFTKILWVDLEMTGLDPFNDPILEVAAIVTDWDFKEIATYEGVIKSDELTLQDRIEANAFWKDHTVARDGLLAQNAAGKDLMVIEEELLEFISKHIEDERVLLGGNSIHMDRRFIAAQWQKLDAKLHYRMLDVSAWKVVFENKFGKKFIKPEDHRALEDIRGSIAELKYYLGKVKLS